MRYNAKTISTNYTHEGAAAPALNIHEQLKRSVLACLLGENSFYENGQKIFDRITELANKAEPAKVAELAVIARHKFKLRSVPLLLARVLAKKMYIHTADLLEAVIERPDEICEFLALYWMDNNGKKTLTKQVKLGLQKAFYKFDEYQLAKYDRDGKVKLRDALILCHAKPRNKKESELFKKILERTLETPDTWEVELSAGKDKKEVFTRLMQEQKLGGLAFLRNLRNMQQAGVDEDIIKNYFGKANFKRVLPYRFIAAAKYYPQMEPQLEASMIKAVEGLDKLSGKTLLAIDVSGSMEDKLSNKSDLTRIDAACGLAILARELCENIEVVTFSNTFAVVPPRRGFALRDAIDKSQPHAGTITDLVFKYTALKQYTRLILITDEQSHTPIEYKQNLGYAYIINVASYQNGIGFGDFVRMTGFSESLFTFIQEYESNIAA